MNVGVTNGLDFEVSDSPESRTDWKRLREMSDEEVIANALSDPDAQPLTDEELDEMEPALSDAYVYRDYYELKGKKAEQFTCELAVKTFLTDWCYPNPTLPNGKELCNLLIVFDNVAIIWQVKDLKWRPDGKHHPSEIEKNINQTLGARRQLFDLKTPVLLENPRRSRERFDPSIINEVFLIAASVGDGEDVFFGVEERKGHLIHLFSAEFTEIVLRELDTISDFVQYLRDREAMFRQPITQFHGAEKNLLAAYLRNAHSFNFAGNRLVSDGEWETFVNSSDYARKTHEDRFSRGWDYLINRVHEGSKQYERIARELARPNRFHRRALGKAFFDAHREAHLAAELGSPLYRRIVVGEHDTTYCFVFVDGLKPRGERISELGQDCLVARARVPENSKVIGIATEMRFQTDTSYDFFVAHLPELPEKNRREMIRKANKAGVFSDPRVKFTHEEEYPKT